MFGDIAPQFFIRFGAKIASSLMKPFPGFSAERTTLKLIQERSSLQFTGSGIPTSVKNKKGHSKRDLESICVF